MRELLTALALVVLFVQPAAAGRWQQRHIDLLNCLNSDWTPSVTAMVAEWNACKVVTISVVAGSCPDTPSVVTGKIALYNLDGWPSGNGNAQTTYVSSNTLLTWAYTFIYTRTGYPLTSDERHYIVGHEMGHAIAVLPHVPGLTTSIMSPSIVNPHVTPYDCSTLKSMYKGH